MKRNFGTEIIKHFTFQKMLYVIYFNLNAVGPQCNANATKRFGHCSRCIDNEVDDV